MTILTEQLRKEYLSLRKKRGDRLLFLGRSTPLKTLARLIAYEHSNIASSDALLEEVLLNDLIQRKLIHETPLTDSAYPYGDITFYDITIRTIDNGHYCRGTSIYRTEALAKALGEVFERTSVRYPPPGLLEASSHELAKRNILHVPPAQFPQPTEKQKSAFPEMHWSNTDTFSWISCRDARTHEVLLLPAQCVFYRNRTLYPHEQSIVQPSTHGAGAGFGAMSAYHSAVCEITHRHFFLKNWYEGVAPSRIDPASIPPESVLGSVIRSLEGQGFILHLLDYSAEARVPSCIAFLEKNGGMFCGGTSGMHIDTVLLRAISEAFATYEWTCRTSLRGGYSVTKADIDSLSHTLTDPRTSAYNRVLWYSNTYFLAQNKEACSFGTNIPYTQSVQNSTLDCAESHFPHLYRYDVADNEILSAYDYHVCKVVSTDAYIFSVAEIYSRPVISGEPRFTRINPFP